MSVLTWSFWDRALFSTFHQGLSPSVTILFLPHRIRKMEREGADHAARGPSSLYVPLLNARWLSLIKVKSLSRVRFFATPWTVGYQAPPSMGFPRQEYQNGCHFLLQRIFLTQGSNPHLLHWQILYHWATREALSTNNWGRINTPAFLPFDGMLSSHYRWRNLGLCGQIGG